MARADALEAYRAKRRFGATPEPRGGRPGTGRAYAIQKHAARRLHYDLRLELDGVLKSWAITRGPSLDPSEKRLAIRTEDHPVEYAGFEGTIPEGHYGAGTVMLWDRGQWEPVGDPHDGLARGKLTFRLHGERLRGAFALVRLHPRKGERRESWLLVKMTDADARGRGDVLARATRSVRSERTLAEIARGTTSPPAPAASPARLPAFVAPQLATLVETVPSGREWMFELKYDGYRLIVAAHGDHVRIWTRNRQDWTRRFPTLARGIAALALDGVLLDGEVVAIDARGRSDFGLLQRTVERSDQALVFFAFDLLSEGGKSVRDLPLDERKRRLRALLGRAPKSGPVRFGGHVAGDGAAVLRAVCAEGMEGIVAKRRDGTYRSGRGRSWLKIKCGRENEFSIVGWSPSDRGRPFASLLLARREGKTLRYAGRVGSGFSARALERLAGLLAKHRRMRPPIADAALAPQDARWVAPALTARVAFAEITRDGLVRHGRFLGLRDDLPAGDGKEAGMGETTILGVALTHPERVLFPEQGITKGDLAAYYAAVADRMLPYLAGRPVSLVRCPSGRAKQCFFQRHGGAGLPPSFRRVTVEGKDGAEEYVHIDDARGLVEAAQLGVLELHLWGARADAVDRPERIVLDLDPDPIVPFARVRDAARGLRDALDALGLRSFPLLTGGKGVHVVVPIARRGDWQTAKAFARRLAERFAEAEPDRFVATVSKARRKGRIFIDYLRNDRGATAIAPYSPRARPGAPVAWPVTWEELARTDTAAAVDMAAARTRLSEPDPWRGYAALRQSLTRSMLRAVGVDG